MRRRFAVPTTEGNAGTILRWFQPISKVLVKLDHSRNRDEKQKNTVFNTTTQYFKSVLQYFSMSIIPDAKKNSERHYKVVTFFFVAVSG